MKSFPKQRHVGVLGSAWASNFWAAKARDKEQLLDAKGLASAARDYLLEAKGVAGPHARGEGL